MELDIKSFLETSIPSITAYPMILPPQVTLPAVMYKEVSFGRNENSNLIDSKFTNNKFVFTFVTKSPAESIEYKNQLTTLLEGYSGTMGSTNILTTRVVSSVPLYDSKQQTYEYSVDVVFVKQN